jgi:hypothetical protein
MAIIGALLAAAQPTNLGDPLAFYTVAATVIPVLFIALVFEGKGFDHSTESERITTFLIATVLMAAPLRR